MALKSGIKTSEFWSAKITQVVLGLFLVSRGTDHIDETSGEALAVSAPPIIEAIVIAVMGLIELGYSIVRAWVKKSNVEPKVYEREVPVETYTSFKGFHGGGQANDGDSG